MLDKIFLYKPSKLKLATIRYSECKFHIDKYKGMHNIYELL